jgi:cyclopropane fatty-acyl-phospholipid synthase-like methyltransferase
MVFNKNYSDVYNKIYKKKKYLKEADYISAILKKNKILKGDILELGLGTGNHAKYLLKKKYKITGVEKSSSMIAFAKKIPKLKCILGDVRTVRLNKKFNAVISMFHVINYMLSSLDLNNFFKTANIHLNDNGLLVFDTWNDRSVKIKNLSDSKAFKINNYIITRKSNSKIIKNKIISIKFKFINALNNKIISTFSEKHLIRYFSFREIMLKAKQNGFQLISRFSMLKFSIPLKNDKNICFVFKKLN